MSELRDAIRVAYAAFSRGEVEAVMDLLHPSLDPQPLRGRDAVRRYLAPNFFESQSAEPIDVLEEGNRVLVIARVRARGRESGVELDQTAYHLWTVAEGRAVRFAAFVDRDEALAALSER